MPYKIWIEIEKLTKDGDEVSGWEQANYGILPDSVGAARTLAEAKWRVWEIVRQFGIDPENSDCRPRTKPLTLADAKRRWNFHSKHVLSREATAAAKNGVVWIMIDGVPHVILGGKWAYHACRDNCDRGGLLHMRAGFSSTKAVEYAVKEGLLKQ